MECHDNVSAVVVHIDFRLHQLVRELPSKHSENQCPLYKGGTTHMSYVRSTYEALSLAIDSTITLQLLVCKIIIHVEITIEGPTCSKNRYTFTRYLNNQR